VIEKKKEEEKKKRKKKKNKQLCNATQRNERHFSISCNERYIVVLVTT